MSIESLLERLLASDRSAISEALNLVDDHRSAQRESALELLDRLSAQPDSTRAHVVGFTGAPGAGKSSLLNALVESLREASARVTQASGDDFPRDIETATIVLAVPWRIPAGNRAAISWARGNAILFSLQFCCCKIVKGRFATTG